MSAYKNAAADTDNDDDEDERISNDSVKQEVQEKDEREIDFAYLFACPIKYSGRVQENGKWASRIVTTPKLDYYEQMCVIKKTIKNTKRKIRFKQKVLTKDNLCEVS